MKRPLLPMTLLLFGLACATPASDQLAAGDYARAYDTALNARDYLTASQAALAMSLYRNGNDWTWLNRAEEASRQAIGDNPQSARAYLNLGSALGLKADLSGLSLNAFRWSRECRAAYEKSIDLNPQFADGRVNLAHWHSGAYAKAGRVSGGNPEYARKLALQALEDAPQSAYVSIQAAYVFRDLKDYTKARALLEKGLDLPARDAQERDLQGQAKTALAKLK